ncbi:glycoside hydrolase family 43 protein [Microbacterium mangrovi]|uniref:glycoside hydrolase family 43 protein n=1 Tax=Microbacterium mangrovi TaxID=1348253 RepID=UPI000690CEFB|nr:glycoside hydrolase family 43 protein [Microbacterium mangrovi]
MIATRPVIPGFHPDPSICHVDGTFYLVNSSFEYAPGVPIFTSTDLVSWTQIGNVLTTADQLDGVNVRPSGGIYAPTLRHHGGLFWMITTNVTNGPGQILTTAEDPAGPWSEPMRIPEAVGIDPDLAWDEDGRCWLSWSGEQPVAQHGILQAQLDTDTGSLLTDPVVIWRGTGGQYPEGPHLYEHDGNWYLVIAEGGTERGHAVTVARATSPNGPFSASPSNPFLTARGTDWPTQNIGHADLVELADGTWAAVFLGVRPHGSTPGWHVLGRETFATRVAWTSGWPRLGDAIEPAEDAIVTESLGADLPVSFVSPTNDPQTLLVRDHGSWQLRGPQGTFVGRRQEHLFTVTTARIGAGGGLEVRVDPRNRLTIEVGPVSIRAVARIGDVAIDLGEALGSQDALVELRTEPSDGPQGTPECGPDTIVARFFDGSGWRELGRLDGRYLSTEVAGGFTGRIVGVTVVQGDVAISEFTYTGSDSFEKLPPQTIESEIRR